VETAMKHVGAVVDVELDRRAVEDELPAGDAVGIAPDGCAKKLSLGEIFIERIMAEHDVVAHSVTIGHVQRVQHRAERNNSGLESVRAGQHVALELAAVGHPAEGRTFDGGLASGCHDQNSKASTLRRRPSRKASATICSGARSTSHSPFAANSTNWR